MEVYVLDTNFKSINIIDYFESLIWTDRFSKCGDFEIYTPIDKGLLDLCKQDYYLWYKDSEYMMIIEDIEKETDIENGDHLKITGRSLESILYRRIIWDQTIVSGNLQDCIKKLLDENIISPTIADRKISNFIFEASTDENITKLSLDSAQYTGDNLYDVINKLCESYSIGFKITLNSSNQFVFKLISGTNRSYSQTLNPYVVFSPKFENIMNSNTLNSTKTLKNVALVAGEGEGSARKTTTIGSSIGIDRRELFTDARDISSTVDGGTISDTEYYAQLTQRGNEDLSKNKVTKTFDGDVEATQLFSYGKDFFLGDVVQLVDENGDESTSRIDEMVRSQDKNGIDVHPTFTILEK